jgi:hypothetical protein
MVEKRNAWPAQPAGVVCCFDRRILVRSLKSVCATLFGSPACRQLRLSWVKVRRVMRLLPVWLWCWAVTHLFHGSNGVGYGGWLEVFSRRGEEIPGWRGSMSVFPQIIKLGYPPAGASGQVVTDFV